MEEINWMTVIISIAFSTITVIAIAKLMIDKMILKLEKSDDQYVLELEKIKKEIINLIRLKKS